MACDCNKTDYSCPGQKTTSNCVLWAGDPFPSLGICKGDPLTFTNQIILENIVNLIAVTSKPLNVNTATCDMIAAAMVGKDKNIENILQVLINNQCVLRDSIKKVESEIPTSTPYSFDLKCVISAGSTTDPNAILQGTINKVCSLETQVNALAPSVETIINDKVTAILATALKSLGNRGIVKAGTGVATTFTFTAFVPPFTPLPYYGPLTNFDGNGKGVNGTAFEGWYLCNGQNGTPDMRGRVPVASVAGVPGGALDSAVDPANGINPGCNYITGDKVGENYHTNTIAETAAHGHPIIDPGHNHQYQYPGNEEFSGSKFNSAAHNTPETRTTTTSFTNITIGITGGGQPHNNRQPSVAVTGFIMRID